MQLRSLATLPDETFSLQFCFRFNFRTEFDIRCWLIIAYEPLERKKCDTLRAYKTDFTNLN